MFQPLSGLGRNPEPPCSVADVPIHDLRNFRRHSLSGACLFTATSIIVSKLALLIFGLSAEFKAARISRS